ncbi:MAG: hypothetical protein CFE32_07815 [Alphaproteobacteria bacterium PA3]|nr:MAG: hypothetical protein CFE32_07815 [Alphaproteobacteria bacterium PA3]
MVLNPIRLRRKRLGQADKPEAAGLQAADGPPRGQEASSTKVRQSRDKNRAKQTAPEFEETPSGTVVAKRTRKPLSQTRHSRFWMESATVALALAGLFAGYLVWRLSIGTVSISATTPFVEDSLSRLVGGQTKIGSLRLGWDQEARDFVVLASQVTARTDQRTSPLRLGKVDLKLDAPSLLIGRAVVKQARLSGVEAVLVVDRQGRTAFGFGSAEEVLALPRIKGEDGGLARILKATRKALDPQGQAGRVAQVVLSDARLQLIDPDSGQRLVLERARAGLFRSAAGIMTLQASGKIEKSNSSMNVAIAAPPAEDGALALVADLQDMRFAQLPLSLRGERLEKLASWTSPLTGRALVYLTPEGSPTSVQGTLQLGRGRAGGVAVERATGTGAWAQSSGIIRLDRLDVVSDRIQATGVSGQLYPAIAGQRRLEFAAKSFSLDAPNMGGVIGEGASGKVLVSEDMHLISADLLAQGFGLSHPNTTSAKLLEAEVKILSNGPRGAQSRSGAQGVFAGGNVSVKAKSARLSLGDRQGTFGGGAGVDLTLDRASASSAWNAQASLASLTLAGRGVAIPQTNARGLALQWSGTDSAGSGRLTARVDAMTTNQSGARGLGLAGANLAVEATRNGDGTLDLTSFRADSFAFNNPVVSIATGSVALAGKLSSDGMKEAWLKTPILTLTNPSQLSRPFVANNVDLAGDVLPRGVRLPSVKLTHRGIVVQGGVEVELARRGSAMVNLDADIDGEIDVETLMAGWPKGFLPETRTAIANVVKEGVGQTDRLVLRIPAGLVKGDPGAAERIALDFDIRDATVLYLPQMTALTEVSGKAHLTGDSFHVAIDAGKLGDLTLSESSFAIPKFRPKDSEGVVHAKVSGSVALMAQEADREPLRLLSKAQFDPARLDGEGNLELDLSLPLTAQLQPEAVKVQASGRFEQASLQNAFAGLDANDGTVKLAIDNGKVDVSGQAWIAGNPFDFTWVSEPEMALTPGTRLVADGMVDLASLIQIGVDVTAYATGPVRLKLDAQSRGQNLIGADLDADFKTATIVLPGSLWTKPEGEAGHATTRITTRVDGGWTANQLTFDAKGADVRGDLAFSEKLDLVGADFSRIAVSRAADLALRISEDANGLNVNAKGEFLDLSPFLIKRDVTERTVDLLDRPLNLSASIKRLATGQSAALDNVEASILRDQDGWRSLTMTGSSPSGQTQVVMSQQQDGRRNIVGTLSDAGFFASLIYPGAPLTGGTGTIEGELPVVGADSAGTLMVEVKGVSYAPAKQSPILFDLVRLPMTVNGGIIALRDGKADGAAYTVKASGYVDLEDGKLDIRGVATPGGLNRALGEMPLFGSLLGGGQDEGLVGLTFTAQGSLANPKLRTNPISALAPGFLRKLFESQAPLEPPPRLKTPPVPIVPATPETIGEAPSP